MNTVGIRELKTHLSRHLQRVRRGERIVVTERGRAVATIAPVPTRSEAESAEALIADGKARWGGGKPEGCVELPRGSGKAAGKAGSAERRTVSAAVLEDRR